MAKKKRKQYQFKPDPKGTNLLKKLHLTLQQRQKLLKWGLLVALCVLLLVIQDVTMSRFRFSGATTDLAVCIILLIGLYEGMEDGGLFALIASTFYWFSGSAPGPYVIVYLTVLTLGIGYLRQLFWRRSFGSIALCTGIAILAYEILIFITALFGGLTILPRLGVALLTAILTCIVMLPLYPLVKTIAKIGGETWKE